MVQVEFVERYVVMITSSEAAIIHSRSWLRILRFLLCWVCSSFAGFLVVIAVAMEYAPSHGSKSSIVDHSGLAEIVLLLVGVGLLIRPRGRSAVK